MKPETYKTTFDIYLPATQVEAERFVETIEVDAFRSLGEECLTPESTEKIELIKARYLGVMTGADIKAMRIRLGLSQKELTTLLECGEKSLSRWENGHGFPTGIVNKLLRLLDEGFLAPASLEAVNGRRSAVPSERFLRNRVPNVVHYDFTSALVPIAETCSAEDDLLQASSY